MRLSLSWPGQGILPAGPAVSSLRLAVRQAEGESNGGEGGIRTHVPLARQDAFEAPPLRPLRYLSACRTQTGRRNSQLYQPGNPWLVWGTVRSGLILPSNILLTGSASGLLGGLTIACEEESVLNFELRYSRPGLGPALDHLARRHLRMPDLRTAENHAN